MSNNCIMRAAHLLLLLTAAEFALGQLGGAVEDTQTEELAPYGLGATQSRALRRATTAGPVTPGGPEASSRAPASTSMLFVPDANGREGQLGDLTSHASTLGPRATTRGHRQPTVARGDLPPQLDSEETMENVTGLLFSPPEDLTHTPSTRPLQNITEDSQTSYTEAGSSRTAENNTLNPFNFSSVMDDTRESRGTASLEGVTPVDSPVSPPEESHIEAASDARAGPGSDAITLSTPSFLGRHDGAWVWFHVVLRGDCRRVNLNDSIALFSDFVASFSRLVLYDEDHVVVQSLTCSGQEMTVNMSVDSLVYPECEGDFQTLRAHRNLRVDLHNSSFYVESYETKRTLMFETRPDVEEDNSEVLYLTLGGVGVSLVCIVFAGVLFAIYQYCALRKAKLVFVRAGEKYLQHSPRSLRGKRRDEEEQAGMVYKTHTYSVNMYKSYNDLSSADLYAPLNQTSRTAADAAPDAQANAKTQKKTSKRGADEGFPQALWSESITHSTEEFLTWNPHDDKTSSFRRAVQGPEKGPLHPLLVNGRPGAPGSPEDPPTPPTCPASPAIAKGVLKRMDDLISNAFSTSSPNISANGSYISAYSDTTTATTTTTTTTTTSGGGKKAAPVPPSSAENLCLTRITFMGTENPSFRMETDM